MMGLKTVMRAALWLALFLAPALPARADLTIENGIRLVVKSGMAVDLHCGDLTVKSGGGLDISAGGSVACGDVTLEGGAAFRDGAGTLTLNGAWQNDSGFLKSAASTIVFSTACGAANSAVGSGDADGDGMTDGVEGMADYDGDGIYDFLDTNRAPVISAIADVTVDEDHTAGPLSFTVNDAETPAGELQIGVGSSNRSLVPDGNITLAGGGEARTITLEPAANESGTAVITITVIDAQYATAKTVFTLTVDSVNDTPVIYGQSLIHTFETAPVTVTLDDLSVDDPDNEYPADFTLSVAGGENYTLDGTILTAAEGFSGPLTVPVTVSDGIAESAPYALVVYVATRKAVTSTADSGDGSLRRMIADAVPGDVIDLSGVSGTILLSSGELSIDRDLTIDACDSGGVVLDGSGSHRVFTVARDAVVSLSCLGVTGGYDATGGGIYNQGVLTLENVSVYGNTGEPIGFSVTAGGGIYNAGVLNMRNCTVSGNLAEGTGGGIENAAGAVLTMVHCTLYENVARIGWDGKRGDNLCNSGTVRMLNTILAGQSGGGDWVGSGTIEENSGNLVSDGTREPALSGDPLLGPLRDNGGPTLTHLPMADSPVLDAAVDLDEPADRDQRGDDRPAGTASDIGAVEFHYRTLVVETAGEGTGSVTVTINGEELFSGTAYGETLPEGSGVLLTALPGDLYSFTEWEGGDCVNAASCAFVLTKDTGITAWFGPKDTDEDDLTDSDEANLHGTDPLDPDTDNDGLSDGIEVHAGLDPLTPQGPGIPVRVSPEADEIRVPLSASLAVAYRENAETGTHSATRWQIALDEAFSALILDIASETHLLALPVPDLVLEANTVYYWRARFTGTDGLDRTWSDTGSFTTADDDRGDGDGNGLPDNQELSEDESPEILPDPESGWRDDPFLLSVSAEDGTALQAALRLSDDGSELLFFSHTDAGELSETCPGKLSMGLYSMKLTVPEAGASIRVRLYFSPSCLTEDAVIYKYDPVSGWYDYTAYTEIGDDLSCLTVELVDGGYGDADGVANGIIVDPLGAAMSVPSDDDTGDDAYPAASSGGGGGCFISGIFR